MSPTDPKFVERREDFQWIRDRFSEHAEEIQRISFELSALSKGLGALDSIQRIAVLEKRLDKLVEILQGDMTDVKFRKMCEGLVESYDNRQEFNQEKRKAITKWVERGVAGALVFFLTAGKEKGLAVLGSLLK